MPNNESLKIKEITYYRAKKEQGKVVKNGKLATAHDKTFTYDNDGNLIKEERFNANGTLRATRTFKYNSNNQKTEETELDFEGFRNFKLTFEYNTEGLLQKKSIIDADNFTSSYWLYNYDSNHNLSEGKRYGLHHKLVDRKTYSYNKNSNLIEVELFNYEGKTDHKWTYKYDTHNNCIKETEVDKEMGKTFVKERLYNEKNQEIERKIYAADGKLNSIQNFGYDKYNNPVEETYKNKMGLTQIQKTYSYKLDKNNNWITKVEYKNGAPVSITERCFL